MALSHPSSSRSLLFLSGALCCFFLLLFLGARYILIDSFNEVETRDMYKNQERTISILQDELEKLAITCSDYAGWDDAYQFVQDGNQAFIEGNLSQEIFPNLRLNVLAYTDVAGRIVYAQGFDLHSGQYSDLPAGLESHLTPGAKLISLSTPQAQRTGLLNLPEGTLLIAVRPVLTSAFAGPVRGSLILGRWLDAGEISRIAEKLRLPLAIESIDSPLSADFAAAGKRLNKGERLVLEPRGSTSISGYCLFPNLFGKPALILRIDAPRNIYQEGKKAITYFMTWFALVGLSFAFIFYRFWQKLAQSHAQIERSEERNRLVVERTSQAILLLAPETWVIIKANPAAALLLGFSRDELLGVDIRNLMKGPRNEVETELARCQSAPRALHLRHRNGSALIAEGTTTSIPQAEGEALCLMLHDMTEAKRFERELLHQATHDLLTGLPNRSLLADRLNQAIEGARRREQMVALLMFDLDNFKEVNDTLGHPSGDQLLCCVSNRVSAFVRGCDTFARLSGDEFVILLTNIHRIDDVVTVAENFRALFDLPFQLEGQEIAVTVSIGIALFPIDGDSMDGLVKKADIAMYRSKERGRNRVLFFDEVLNQELQGTRPPAGISPATSKDTK